jgi:hypothetical protein
MEKPADLILRNQIRKKHLLRDQVPILFPFGEPGETKLPETERKGMQSPSPKMEKFSGNLILEKNPGYYPPGGRGVFTPFLGGEPGNKKLGEH